MLKNQDLPTLLVKKYSFNLQAARGDGEADHGGERGGHSSKFYFIHLLRETVVKCFFL